MRACRTLAFSHSICLFESIVQRHTLISSYLSSANKYYDLDLDATFALHNEIRGSYATWLRDAPREYRDTLCGSSIPVAFSSKHGQNRLVAGDVHRDLQRNFWALSVDHQHLSVYKVALAVHIQ